MADIIKIDRDCTDEPCAESGCTAHAVATIHGPDTDCNFCGNEFSLCGPHLMAFTAKVIKFINGAAEQEMENRAAQLTDKVLTNMMRKD